MAWNRKNGSPWLAYVIAALLPVCAALLRLKLQGVLGLNSPFLTFYPAVILAALLAGLPGGLLATGLSGSLAWRLWVEPAGTPSAANGAHLLETALFLISCSMISAVTALLLRARARACEAEAKTRLTAQREQASIQRERNFLRQVIDAFPSAVFVKDRQGTLVLVNRAMAKFHGTEVENLEGKRVCDFGLVPDDLASRFSDEDREIFSDRKVLRSAATIRDAGGNPHSFETDKSPLYNEDGSCDKLLVVTTDVTERKQAEEALHENRELLNSIITGTPDAIYVKDTAGKYLLFNRAAQKITGKSGGEVLGRDDSEIFSPQEALAMVREDRSVMGTRSVETFENTLTDALGRKRVFLNTKGPLYDDHGTLTGTFGISRDISEQKQVEQEFRRLNDELDKRVAERTAQLEAANREVESFSYSVSHDLRSPLRHINSYAAILMEELGPGVSAEGKDSLERICKASNKMGRLIDDLLELARTSRLPLSEEQIDLSRLATICGLMLKQTEKSRRVEFLIADGLQVLGDKTLLRLVVENLLDNAWKYTVGESVARIEVGSEVRDGRQVFFVSDNGTGFDMAYREKLFSPFQRLHGAEFEGNGIGLATVKRAVERHGGTIWAEGEVGNGATFYFTLGRDEVGVHRPLRQQNG